VSSFIGYFGHIKGVNMTFFLSFIYTVGKKALYSFSSSVTWENWEHVDHSFLCFLHRFPRGFHYNWLQA
jgi:hypothetical protein